MANKNTTVIDGVATSFEVLSIISEHKNQRGTPRGMVKVMAVVKCGLRGKPETRHVVIEK